MTHSLFWSVFALGGAGWLYGWLMAAPRGADRSSPPLDNAARWHWLAAIALPVLVFLVTLPDTKPFAAGQGWGRGFALGAVGALLAACVVFRARDRQIDGTWRAAIVTAPMFAALPVTTIPLLWMRPTLIDALAGVAIGWFCVAFVLLMALDRADDAFARLALSNGAAFAVAVCALAALGVYRDPTTPHFARGTWSAVALTLAAGVPLGLLLGALLVQSGAALRRAASLWSAGLAAVVLLALAQLLAVKVLEEPRLFWVAGVGLLTGLVAWWGVRDATGNAANEGGVPPLAALVLLSGFMVAYQILQGFGAGVLLLLAWLPLGLELSAPSQSTSQPHHPTTSLARLMLFGTALLLYRWFEMRFRTDLYGATLSDHYALFGFLCGATAPAFLAGMQGRPGASLLRLLPVAALALAVPGALLALWGAKPALALLAGLALAAVLEIGAARRQTGEVAVLFTGVNAALLAIASGLALTQWTHHVLPLAHLTRAQRMHFLSWGLALVLVTLLISEYAVRLMQRSRRAV